MRIIMLTIVLISATLVGCTPIQPIVAPTPAPESLPEFFGADIQVGSTIWMTTYEVGFSFLGAAHYKVTDVEINNGIVIATIEPGGKFIFTPTEHLLVGSVADTLVYDVELHHRDWDELSQTVQSALGTVGYTNPTYFEMFGELTVNGVADNVLLEYAVIAISK